MKATESVLVCLILCLFCFVCLLLCLFCLMFVCFVCLLLCLFCFVVFCLFQWSAGWLVGWLVGVTSMASDLPFRKRSSPFEIPRRIEPGTFSIFPNVSQAHSLQNMDRRLSCLGLKSASLVRRSDPPKTKTSWRENSRVESSSSSRRFRSVCFLLPETTLS